MQARATRLAVLTLSALAMPAIASAHLERPSYWPDPAPDRSVSPPAGGKVPKARSLGSAVSGRGPGEVRVVCKGSSLQLAKRSIRRAHRSGFRLRPSQPKKKLSDRKADRLLDINGALFEACAFRSIQKAVDRSGNNDRIVIMPGRYTEPKSRKSPVNDPRCNPSLLQQDQTGTPTPSYEYQATCPNDQNLVYVQGRAIKGSPLATPDPDRHGIPEQELGRCIRCNLQIEGSGARPEDVLIDAGSAYENPKRPGARPSSYGKHVVMRTDRSDGFVGRNFLLRGALEHGFYTEETDGILLDRVKFFWNGDYGHLSFTTDHNVIKNCDGFGAGDAVVYPGAAPQTGEFRDQTFYPQARYNTVVKRCDLHGSTIGYSGSMGNSVRVTRNRFYGNTTALTSDTLSAPGHPGYPADGMKIDHNWFYANNLNLYTEDPPLEPFIGVPVGTGILWAGYNDGLAAENWFFDNWGHGAVLLAVPDAVAGDTEGNVDSEIHCQTAGISSTSCANRFARNHMGQIPAGFETHPGLGRFGNKTTLDRPLAESAPNGVDFWWDEFPGNTGNCWFDNTGPDGTEDSITAGGGAPPDLLPSNCGASVGLGDPIKEAVLLDCALWSRGDTAEDHPLCYWFRSPERPGSSAAAAQQRGWLKTAREYARSDEGRALRDRLDEIAAESAFANRHR